MLLVSPVDTRLCFDAMLVTALSKSSCVRVTCTRSYDGTGPEPDAAFANPCSTNEPFKRTDKTRQKRQKNTRQDKTRQDKPRQGKARQGKARHKTRQDKRTPDKTRQEKKRQDKTRQGKTKQVKTRQNKTKQDKLARQEKTKRRMKMHGFVSLDKPSLDFRTIRI